MITRLTGILIEKQPGFLVLDVGGVGYEVHISMQTYYGLPAVDQRLTLHTQMIVRDDAHLLVGFATKKEREAFNLVQKVSGIGMKTALSLLSSLSGDDLAQALHQAQVDKLTKVPGIGKKTAERLILELGDKLITKSETLPVSGVKNDIIGALLNLGFSEKIAKNVVAQLPEDINLNDGIKLALKQLH